MRHHEHAFVYKNGFEFEWVMSDNETEIKGKSCLYMKRMWWVTLFLNLPIFLTSLWLPVWIINEHSFWFGLFFMVSNTLLRSRQEVMILSQWFKELQEDENERTRQEDRSKETWGRDRLILQIINFLSVTMKVSKEWLMFKIWQRVLHDRFQSNRHEDCFLCCTGVWLVWESDQDVNKQYPIIWKRKQKNRAEVLQQRSDLK